MGKQNFIEINGKKYDTITGKLLDVAPGNGSSTIAPTKLKKNVGIVDGVVRPNRKTVLRRRPKQIGAKPQKSQTLMRSAVVKPVDPNPQKNLNKSLHKSIIKKLGMSPARVRHSHQIHQSPKIKKYSDIASNGATTEKIKEHAPLIPRSIKRAGLIPVRARQPKTTATEKLINTAVANATTHNEQPHPHKYKHRGRIITKLGISTKVVGISMAVLAAVLLGGFFAVQNVPNLAMKVAATRSGFDATMPGYNPSGFSFKGPINYSSGKVTISFKSNTDNRSYSLTEQSSNWNSDALLSNLKTENKQYQTYLDRGRTLYIYDGSNATWVDNGIWYQIEGTSSKMTTDQLIRIAASI